MSRLSGRHCGPEPETDIDMVPVMNMFLVLIPFLLMSASFLHLKAINTSVPVQAENSGTPKVRSEVKVVVVVEILEDRLKLSAVADGADPAVLAAVECELRLEEEQYPLADLTARLGALKQHYPLSDTVLVVPHGSVLYDTIIRTMDAARFCEGSRLFPNVVLSGKVG